jgi:3-methyladenine DNA glycosylase/8-oxoguanine DNA glycosylase
MFADLQEAMDWGLKRLGGDSFRIKYISVARVEREDEGTVDNDAESSYEEADEEELSPNGRLLS